MVEGVVLNLTDFLSALPPSWTSWIKGIFIFLGIASVFFVVYLVYLVISIVISIRRTKALKRMEEKIDDIHKKVVQKK